MSGAMGASLRVMRDEIGRGVDTLFQRAIAYERDRPWYVREWLFPGRGDAQIDASERLLRQGRALEREAADALRALEAGRVDQIDPVTVAKLAQRARAFGQAVEENASGWELLASFKPEAAWWQNTLFGWTREKPLRPAELSSAESAATMAAASAGVAAVAFAALRAPVLVPLAFRAVAADSFMQSMIASTAIVGAGFGVGASLGTDELPEAYRFESPPIVPPKQPLAPDRATVLEHARFLLQRSRQGYRPYIPWGRFHIASEMAFMKRYDAKDYERRVKQWDRLVTRATRLFLAEHREYGAEQALLAVTQMLVNEHLYNFGNGLTGMTNFLAHEPGNCVANTKFMLAALSEVRRRARGKFPPGVLAVQLFGDHLQPVIYEPARGRIWNLMNGWRGEELNAPLYLPEDLFLYGLLRRQAWGDETSAEVLQTPPLELVPLPFHEPEWLQPTVKTVAAAVGEEFVCNDSIYAFPFHDVWHGEGRSPERAIISPPHFHSGDPPSTIDWFEEPKVVSVASAEGAEGDGEGRNRLVNGHAAVRVNPDLNATVFRFRLVASTTMTDVADLVEFPDTPEGRLNAGYAEKLMERFVRGEAVRDEIKAFFLRLLNQEVEEIINDEDRESLETIIGLFEEPRGFQDLSEKEIQLLRICLKNLSSEFKKTFSPPYKITILEPGPDRPIRVYPRSGLYTKEGFFGYFVPRSLPFEELLLAKKEVNRFSLIRALASLDAKRFFAAQDLLQRFLPEGWHAQELRRPGLFGVGNPQAVEQLPARALSAPPSIPPLPNRPSQGLTVFLPPAADAAPAKGGAKRANAPAEEKRGKKTVAEEALYHIPIEQMLYYVLHDGERSPLIFSRGETPAGRPWDDALEEAFLGLVFDLDSRYSVLWNMTRLRPMAWDLRENGGRCVTHFVEFAEGRYEYFDDDPCEGGGVGPWAAQIYTDRMIYEERRQKKPPKFWGYIDETTPREDIAKILNPRFIVTLKKAAALAKKRAKKKPAK